MKFWIKLNNDAVTTKLMSSGRIALNGTTVVFDSLFHQALEGHSLVDDVL